MKVIKYLLLFLIFTLFIFQIVQVSFPLYHFSPLIGTADSTKLPKLTLRSYYQRDFQPVFQKYAEEKMGFRPFLIKTKNQIDYTLFKYTDAPGVVLGKNRMLFIESYIQNYKGVFFKGEKQIQNDVKRLKMIQDELKKHNVDFLIIFAPGKASFYSENIPDRYKQRPVTNYECYVQSLSGSGVHFIDMNAWFLQLKGKTKYPLYPLNGTHWTSYGIGLAADTMFRYIETLRKIDLPDFSWDSVAVSGNLRYSDNDIGELLNLMSPVKQIPMPYPHFIYKNEGKIKPKVIAIGDSYYWGFLYTGIAGNVFANDNYWFYFRDIIVKEQKTGLVADLDIKEQLFSQDIVILMATEATFQLFPYGFIEGFFEKCMLLTEEAYQMKIEMYVAKIKNDPKWYKAVEEKARKKGHTVDEQLIFDAKYMISQDEKK